MKPRIHDPTARQHSGEPSPVRHRNGNRHDPPRRPDLTDVERQIAGLANRSTQDLRVGWRQLKHTGSPLGVSRDLLIRALANQLQERRYGGVSRALRRRLQSLAGALENGAVDPGLVLYGRAVVILGASGGSAFGALVPALSALFAVPLVGEWPNRTDWLGIMLISAGV